MEIGFIAVIIIGIVIIILQTVSLISSRRSDRSRDILDATWEVRDDLMQELSEQSGNLNGMGRSVHFLHDTVGHMQGELTRGLHDGFKELSDLEARSDHQMMQSLQEGFDRIGRSTSERLDAIQADMNKKLDVSLNRRLDESFSRVSQQLSQLYKSLGELDRMSDGIQSLNRTLSNVKARGTWGEAQLERILEETLPKGQYVRNVKLSEHSEDFVEFAIKIPSKEDGETYILLPIDSKFPMDRYSEVADAAESGDPAALQHAVRDLSYRMREEAKKIQDKYILPPVTTDFAIMFLPTESLYAEALRIDGLAETLQNKYRVVISGPTTITALLNSLSIGFANLALNEKTNEVRKLLQAVKTQYTKLDELIDKTQRRLELAVQSTGELKSRTQIIRKRMAKVGELDTLQEADDLLLIPENEDYLEGDSYE